MFFLRIGAEWAARIRSRDKPHQSPVSGLQDEEWVPSALPYNTNAGLRMMSISRSSTSRATGRQGSRNASPARQLLAFENGDLVSAYCTEISTVKPEGPAPTTATPSRWMRTPGQPRRIARKSQSAQPHDRVDRDRSSPVAAQATSQGCGRPPRKWTERDCAR
jgi:hypothetical protein